MKSMKKIMLAGLAATAVISAAAMAADTRNQGYETDINGNIVTSSNTGLCWRSSDWTPARAVAQCDPDLVRVAAAPAPAPAVIAAAPPAPAPQPARAAPTRKKMSFSADALFAFDKSVLKPEGKTMLDGLVRDLKGVSYDVIALTGHADRFGSNTYNQKLSMRRADAVKDYLVVNGVPAGRITAEGKGETQPETKPGDCKGAKSAKVVACLQPDRRVDVEMTGVEGAGS